MSDTRGVDLPGRSRRAIERFGVGRIAIVGVVVMAVVVTACDPSLIGVGDEPAGADGSVPVVVGASCDDRPLLSDRTTDGTPVVCVQTDAGWAWESRDPRLSDRPLVLYYSDSIGYESVAVTRMVLDESVDIVYRGFPGTAPCDWLPELEDDISTLHPDLVVGEFIGNNNTPCMSSADDLDEIVAAYRDDARRFEALVGERGTRMLWLTAPHAFFPDVTEVQDRVEDVLAEGALLSLVTMADTGAVLEDPQGVGLYTMPCAEWEGEAEGCHDGGIIVRSDDGVHLCVGGDGRATCPGYSSGQFRYGAAVAAAITDHT